MGNSINLKDRSLTVWFSIFFIVLGLVWSCIFLYNYRDAVVYESSVEQVLEDHYDELVLFNELLGQVYRAGSVTEEQLAELGGYVREVGESDIKVIEKNFSSDVASRLLSEDRGDLSDEVYRAQFVTSLDSHDLLNLDSSLRFGHELFWSMIWVTLWVLFIGAAGFLVYDYIYVYRACKKIDREIGLLRDRIEGEDFPEEVKTQLIADVEERIFDFEMMKTDLISARYV